MIFKINTLKVVINFYYSYGKKIKLKNKNSFFKTQKALICILENKKVEKNCFFKLFFFI